MIVKSVLPEIENKNETTQKSTEVALRARAVLHGRKETLKGRSELSLSAESGDGRIPGQRIYGSFTRKVFATHFMCTFLVLRGDSNLRPRHTSSFQFVERIDVKRYNEIEGENSAECGLL